MRRERAATSPAAAIPKPVLNTLTYPKTSARRPKGITNAATVNVNTTSRAIASEGGVPRSLANTGRATLRALRENGVTKELSKIERRALSMTGDVHVINN
ncbi:hypothetical protein [Pyrobaculum aerophilum]|uniref:hypothetical protein n=1 Tax=Pyrobaculum aerophilum TaxID=13773 RepID=UPI00403F296F